MSLCIKVENLTKHYNGNLIIDNLNLSVDEGEIVVFQGPSGIGKSTFLRCLTYLETFQKGKIIAGNIEINAEDGIKNDSEKVKLLREQLGFVFQFFNLFPHLTVLENLIIGPVKVHKHPIEKAKEEAMHLLGRVGLLNKENAYPSALSGGQMQRVCIARALSMHPRAILFDEPTSSLDPEMKSEIVKVIEDFGSEITMLIVTHEPAVVERIASRIIKFGPHCSILSDEKVLIK